MTIRYVAVITETIKSVITTGRYPTSLPEYVLKMMDGKADVFDCKHNYSDCLLAIREKPLDQIFVLELSIPNNGGFRFAAIKPEWVQKIYVYSEHSKKLVDKLCGGKCPRSLSVQPHLYWELESLRKREALVCSTAVNNVASFASSSAAASIIPSAPIPLTYQYLPSFKNDPMVERLDTFDKHRDFLQRAFRVAKRTILMTTDGIRLETLSLLCLDELIRDAHRRDVKIYIYNHPERPMSREVLNYFSGLGITIQNFNTYSQILAVDNTMVGIGSFNWLSNFYGKYDATLVCYGVRGRDLSDYVWGYIGGYRNIWDGRYHELPNCEILDDEELTYFEPDFGYLDTREGHRAVIEEAFLMAEERIIIFSPFISEQLLEEFLPEKICKTAARGVKIYFICSPDQIKAKGFDHFIQEKVNHPNVQLISREEIHAKTVMIDRSTLLEGSFNWLSASKNTGKHEVTLLCRGNTAEKFIEEFERSELGRAVLEKPENHQGKRQRVK